MQSDHKDSATAQAGGLERVVASSLAQRRARFDRARAQLSQVVGEALESGLEALGDRLQVKLRPSSSVRAQMGERARAHGHRLREVIERDRALIATSPIEPTAEETEPRERVPTPPVEHAALPTRQPLPRSPLLASATLVAPVTAALCDEPIRTRTMAKLLASQGHRQRALSIYDHLLAKSATDEALRAEAEALRASD